MKTSYKYDIHDRIYTYVARVLNFLNFVPRTTQNLILIGQVARSVTSMGANDREADGVTTRNDFIHKYSTVRKEAKETDYWLRLIADTNEKLKPKMIEMIDEGNEIIKIVTSIIYNTKNSIKEKNK